MNVVKQTRQVAAIGLAVVMPSTTLFAEESKPGGDKAREAVMKAYDATHPGKTTGTANQPTASGPYSAQPTVSGLGTEGYHTTDTVQGRQVWVAGNMLYFDLPDGTFPVGQTISRPREICERDIKKERLFRRICG